MREEIRTTPTVQFERLAENNQPLTALKIVAAVHNITGRYAGVVRNGAGMQQGLAMLETIANRLPAPDSRRNCEAANIQQVATLILRSALARTESRGAHFRTDFPEHDDTRFRKHSILHRHRVTFES
jgi:L-aspartate oxidase